MALVLSATSTLIAQTPPPAEQPNQESTKVDEAKIKTLIQQLGADDWQTRELAHKKLTELGKKLIEQYRQIKSNPGTQRTRSKIESVKNEITKLAQALREACQNKDTELRIRSNQIRQYFYHLSQPWVVFTSIDYNPEIYVTDARGGNIKRLTENYTLDNSPAWNPDGTKIAFCSDRGGSWEIYVMDANGKNQERLTENRADNRSPAWSSDGTKIAFNTDRDGNYEIYVMDTSGKNQERLTKNNTDDYGPVWNPDGTKIAFASKRDGNWEIYVMDANGKNQERLTKNNAYNSAPCWSSDGTKIAFKSDRDGDYEIYMMDAGGGNIKRLTENKIDDFCPALSSSLPEISDLFRSKD